MGGQGHECLSPDKGVYIPQMSEKHRDGSEEK